MSLARDLTAVGTATLLSRLLGFLRDIGMAAVLGAGTLADAYFAAIQIPNLFRRLVTEGALNPAFVPMWLRFREEGGMEASRRFGEEILGLMILVLGMTTILGLIIAPALVNLLAPGFRAQGEAFAFAVDFLRLSLPYIAIAGLVAVAAAILNAEGRVAAPSFGHVVFNIVLIIAVLGLLFVGIRASALAGAILAGAIVVAGLAQLALVGSALIREQARPRRVTLSLSCDVRRFLVQAVPALLASGLPQLKLMAGAAVASSSPAAVSWLYYANRLYDLPLGLIAVAIASVMIPQIAESVHLGRADATAAQSRVFELVFGLAWPAALALAVLAEPIVGGLFERGAFGAHDSAMVAAALAVLAVGVPGHAAEKVFAAVLFARNDARMPMVAAGCGLLATAIGGWVLFPRCGHLGIAAAIALAGWIGSALLGFVLWRRQWLHLDLQARQRLPRIILASLIMAIALGGSRQLLATHAAPETAFARSMTLVGLVAGGLTIYLVSLRALGVARVADIWAAMRLPR